MRPPPSTLICLALVLGSAVAPAVLAGALASPAAALEEPTNGVPPVTTSGTPTRNGTVDGVPRGGPVPVRTADRLPPSTLHAAAVPTDAPAGDGGDSDSPTHRKGRIRSVFPNPVATGDSGEAVRLHLRVAGNWTLADGETVVQLPTRRTGSVLVVAGASGESAVDARDAVVLRATDLSLSNAGEDLVLRLDGRVVHRVTYADAPEGNRLLPGPDGGWRPLGLRPREAVALGPANATLFVLPDAPDVPVETLRGADERILLAGYTLTSTRVADALVAAQDRGVPVTVLLESEPVGGRSAREARLLDRLVAAGLDVRVLGGPHDRFAYHHAKYAVIDDAVLVLTENWKPAGVGGRSSRGWGVRVESARAADELAAVFAHDAGWRDAVPWQRYRLGRSFPFDEAAAGDYPARVDPARVRVRDVRVLTTPGNARSAMVGLVDNATERVDVVQPTVGDDSRLLRACLRAARRGVEVRILVSGAWYVAEDNRQFVEWLDGWAERTGAPLEAKLAEPRGRYEKIHAKGLLVDDRVAVVGSLNWNAQAATENREVLLALVDPAAVAYYRRVFDADWRAGGHDLPLGLLGGVAVAAALALAVGRRTIGFGGAGRSAGGNGGGGNGGAGGFW